MTNTGIRDSNHALLCGQVFGALMQHSAEDFQVQPVMNDGDYTNVVEIERPSGVYRVRVEAPINTSGITAIDFSAEVDGTGWTQPFPPGYSGPSREQKK